MRFRPVALLAIALALTGCPEARPTTPPQETLRVAQRSLDARDSGRIDFALRASAEDTGPVGFEIEGPYAFDRDHELAVVDLTYRMLLGDEEEEWRLVSNGASAWLVVDGEVSAVSADQAAPLRLTGNARSSAVPAMNISSWISQPTATQDQGVVTVLGKVSASALVADLETIAGQVAGSEATTELDADSAEQIDDAVERSEMKVVVEDDALRSLDATVDFGGEVPASVRDALGDYAGARLEVSLSIDDIATPLTVEKPE